MGAILQFVGLLTIFVIIAGVIFTFFISHDNPENSDFDRGYSDYINYQEYDPGDGDSVSQAAYLMGWEAAKKELEITKPREE